MITGIFIGIVVAAIAVGVFFAVQYGRRGLLLKYLNYRLLSIKLPQDFSEQDPRTVIAEINSFAQFLGSFASQKITFALEVAVHHVGSDIHFYVAVPKKSIEFVSRQVQGHWPGAQVSSIDDYTIFNPEGSVLMAKLKHNKSVNLPIRTYAEAELDTFSSILSNLTKVDEIGEGLALQIIVAPPPKSAKKNISMNIRALRKGTRELDAGGHVKEIKKKKDETDTTPHVVDEASIKLIEQKISKPLFSVNVRFVASGSTPQTTQELLDGLTGSFSQFAAPLHNEFKIAPVSPRRLKSSLFKYTFRQLNDKDTLLLNADEIASFFHFPTSSMQSAPRVQWTRGKEVQPPLNLPPAGTLIGESSYRQEVKPVFITEEDRRRHVYVIGQTGTGKSTLLKNMIIEDIEQGKGVGVVDPHGDLVEDTLALVPKERAGDVIVFNPGDIERPLGLNMLESDPNRPEEKTFIVNEMQSIFDRLFSKETMGPMFEQYMRNALLLLMDDVIDPATLMEVPRIFTDPAFRKQKLQRAKNPTVIDFWEKEAVKAGGDASLANMTPYITSKFNNFIANDYVRPIIGQPTSSFNFRRAMDEKKILLVNLSKGRIGDINAGLLGMVVVGKLLMAALSRVDIPQEQRQDFNLYIDEFQNFTTDSIATILSEARKYRLNLVIAHQFIAQLEDRIREAVFGNVGSSIAFRVGAEDAETLIKQFEPVYEKNDLINIDNYNAYVRLLISGQTASPFNIKTMYPKQGDPNLGAKMKELSRVTYGRNRDEVEQSILTRLRTQIAPPTSPRPPLPSQPALPASQPPPPAPPARPPGPPPQLPQQTQPPNKPE